MENAALKIDPEEEVEALLTVEEDDEYNPYLNSRDFEIHRTSDAEEVDRAIIALCSEFGKHTKSFKLHLKVLVCDLYNNYNGCKNRYINVCLSKGKGDFKLIKRYNKFEIGYRNLKESIDFLKDNGYLEYKKGYLRGGFANGFQTRMRATVKLIGFLEHNHDVSDNMICVYQDQELIIRKQKKIDKIIITKNRKGRTVELKVKIKKLDAYNDNEDTKRWLSTLTKYNSLINRTYIDVDLSEYKPKKKRMKPIYIDLSRKRTRRIFSNGHFISGGRFYGGFHQGTPSDMRPFFLINGENVVEHDFSGMSIHILYALIGKRLSDVGLLPYKYAKGNDPENKRPYLKRLLLAAINADSRRECLYAVRKDIRKNPQDYPECKHKLGKLLTEIIEYHPELECFLLSGKGLYSQFVDSSIAYRVIKEMTDKNIPVLCIHDSFISAERYADQLLDCMKRSYVTELNLLLKKNNHQLTVIYEDAITDETTIIQRTKPKTALLINAISTLKPLQVITLMSTKDNDKMQELKQHSMLNRGSLLHTIRQDIKHNKDQVRRQRTWLMSDKQKTYFNETVEVRTYTHGHELKIKVINHDRC